MKIPDRQRERERGINNADVTVISQEWYPQGTLTFSLIEINCHDKKFSSMLFSWSTHKLLKSRKCLIIIIASWLIYNRGIIWIYYYVYKF